MMHILPNKEVVDLPKLHSLAIDIQDTAHHLYAYDILNRSAGSAVCVTFKKPAYLLKDYVHKFDAMHNRPIQYVDAISVRTQTKERIPNATYVSHPQNLQELGQAIEQAVLHLPVGEKTVIIDALQDLALHHHEQTLNHFIDFLNKRTKLLGCNLVFLTRMNTLKTSIQNKVSRISDKILTL